MQATPLIAGRILILLSPLAVVYLVTQFFLWDLYRKTANSLVGVLWPFKKKIDHRIFGTEQNFTSKTHCKPSSSASTMSGPQRVYFSNPRVTQQTWTCWEQIPAIHRGVFNLPAQTDLGKRAGTRGQGLYIKEGRTVMHSASSLSATVAFRWKK